MYWIKKEQENPTVTDYYLETIGTVLETNEKVKYFHCWKETNIKKSSDVVLVSTAPEAVRAFFYGYKYIFWSQGCWPEESKMRHNSTLRFKICSIIEKIALKNAIFVFFVSETMRSFYENKYNLNFENKCYIMPCSNDSMHKEAFVDEKYNNNVFCYVGGTSVWQCFEETIELYSKIECAVENSKLLLLVKDKEKAIELLQKYKVKNYEIDYVDISKLPEKLSEVKFGFVLRKEDPVNYVATPTKVLTYLSSGVIPIYSNSLAGIKTILDETRYKVEFANKEDINKIIKLCNADLARADIEKEFMEVYLKYYDKDKNVKNISKAFRKSEII